MVSFAPSEPMSSNSEEKAPERPSASIEVTKEGVMVVTIPLQDKILAYGVLETAKEEAAKFFYHQQKLAAEIKKASEESGKTIMSRLHLPGFGGKR